MNLTVSDRQEKGELAAPHPEQGGETRPTGDPLFPHWPSAATRRLPVCRRGKRSL